MSLTGQQEKINGLEEKKFEEAMAELEQVVSKLEKGQLSLDEAIEMFQKGIELSKFCSKRLDEVERKIRLLIEDENGSLREENFKGDQEN